MSDYFHGTEIAVEHARQLIADDPEVRATIADEAMLAILRDEQQSTLHLFAESCRIYADRPCLAERPRERTGAPPAPSFRPTSYATLWSRVVALASGWADAGLAARGDFIGICGFASIDFVVADLACLYLGAISVPLQTTASADDLRHVVSQTGMRLVVCSLEHLSTVKPVLDVVPTLVVMDVWPGDSVPEGPATYTIAAVEGRTARPIAPDDSADRGRLVSVLYTSGSTGAPKGAMYLDSTWARRLRYTLREPPIPILTVGCMPLNHVMGRFTVHRAMMRGGLTSFVAASDMSTLLDDIRLARPTTLTIVPRATANMHQHFRTRVLELAQGGAPDAEARALAEMRGTYLGDRLCLVMTGSAATPHDTVVFLERVFGVSVVQFYAFNEFGAVSVNEHVDPDVEYKLEDVPELGYSTKDRPYPRGELLVRSRFPTAGYYQLGDVSANLRDAEGYMRSGDVMEERSPGHVVWIDRKNNVVKLSQGEFVSLTRIEEVLQSSPYLVQVFLYASGKRAYLLAVLVPDVDAARSAGATDAASLRALLTAEIARLGLEAKLPSHEVPRDFLVDERRFTKENGLLTESGKPKRAALKATYGVRLEALYEEIEARQVAIAPEASSPEDRARAAILATLGVRELDVSRSFVGLGGDSFSAVRLSGLLERALGVAAPVSALLDPHVSVEQLVTRLTARPDSRSLDLADLAGGSGSIDAAAVRLERFLPDVSLAPRVASSYPRAVLLTGASGFLGRFLLLELLERAERVVCVVRGADDAAARARTDDLFEGSLRARFERVSARLEVVAGDLTRPRFGLADVVYDALAGSIDAVVHNGALVNHALTYAQLFQPNVLGTIEAIRFALTGKGKSFAFVSSSSVAAGLGRVVGEDETAAALWPSRPLDAEAGGIDYAAGYATSKWASEVLLDDLHHRTGLPVQIVRCSMVLPSREAPHVVNEGDNVTRLVRGILATGIAPRSFYEGEGLPHFDGVPVDVVAAAIATIALEAAPGAHVYHSSNARWGDGESLDSFADAIAAQQPLERLDYATWFTELRARLEKLDEPTRRRSPLPIIERWAQPAGPRFGVHLENTRFREKLRALLGLDDAPPLDAAYLAEVVRALRA